MIRKFEPEDFISLIELEKGAFPKDPYSGSFLLYLSRYYNFLVCVMENKIMGYLVFDTRDGHVISMAVHLERRRKGIGSELMKEVFNACDRSYLEVRVSNHTAQSFYEHLGYTKRGLIENYYGDENAITMIRE